MKVYVVWNRLYERVVGVYSSDDRADEVCRQLNTPGDVYDHEYDEFEIDAEPRP